jgi:hypothetical protein
MSIAGTWPGRQFFLGLPAAAISAAAVTLAPALARLL